MSVAEAKYKALLAGVRDTELIENAEKIVEIALVKAGTSGMPFGGIFWSLMWAISGQKKSFEPVFKEEALSPDQALLTLHNTLWHLLEQWDDTTSKESCRLGSHCQGLADRWVDQVSQVKAWKEQ